MKINKITNLLFSIILILSLQACSDTQEIFVSPGGDDSGKGTERHPFATIARAIESVNADKQVKATIWLMEGIYDLTSTVSLKGSQGILISAFPGENVRITGGRKLTGFVPIDKNSSAYRKLPEDVRDKILQIDLKALGITDYGEIKPRGFGLPVAPSGLMLYFNKKPMTIARWPNNGWVRIKDVPKDLDGKGFSYAEEEPGKWENTGDIWMHGYWKWDWADSHVKISEIDKKKRTITVADPQSPYPYSEKRRYYVYNIIEELDVPGEWYLDKETGVLYFYPPSNSSDPEIYVSLMSDPLFRIDDCTGVTLDGLVLEYSNGAGVEVTGGSDNVIKNCILRDFGTVAVNIGKIDAGSKIYGNTIYNGNAGTNNGVSGCLIYNCGEGGIILGGGDRKTLNPGHNFVERTKIYRTSEWVRTYRAGIFMYGVGNIVRYNEIYDMPHTAVFFWGNDHTIEYNNIHHVCLETADAGAVYNGRDWTQRGHLIRYNYFHHLHGVETEGSFNDVMGVYLDDFSSGTTVFGNIFYKAGRNILIGGGRDNVVKNNIFIDGQPAVHVDARGIGWARTYFDKKKNNTLFKRYDDVNAGNPPYSEKYPQLKTVLDDEPAVAKYNCIENNVFCGGKWRELKDDLTDSIVCFKNNVVKDSCDFYRFDKGKIVIDTLSDIFPEDFETIPVEKIGIK